MYQILITMRIQMMLYMMIQQLQTPKIIQQYSKNSPQKQMMIEKNQLQTDKILQKMFIYADNRDLNFNRIRNLIVNPQILRVLIHHLENASTHDKINVLGRVAEIYQKNSLNVAILAKRDREILEFNHSIFDQIVSFVVNVKIDFNQNTQLFKTVQPLLTRYPITCRNIKNILKKISKNFHTQNFNLQKLQICIQILRQLYKSQATSNPEPKNYFYMYGPNSGIRLMNQQLKWTLAKGMHGYINFFMESSRHQQMNLLHIIVNNDSFQLAIDQDNYLTVKVFQVSKINRLRRVQEKKWYFLKMSYCLRTGIIRNTYQLVIHIQGEPFQIRDLPVPSITIQNNIEQLIIGHEFYGKINFAAISRKQINFWPKTGLNNWGQIQGLLAANKQSIKDIFLIYSPIITTKLNDIQIIYQISSKNHGELLQNTATYINPFDEVQLNYYGSLYTLLPFFYILKFYKFGQYPTALEQILELILTIFQSGFKNVESQAVNCQFFGIIGQFMNQIDQRYITDKVIDILVSFKDIIQSKVLSKQFLANLLLKIRIDRIQSQKIITKIHKLIQSYYYKDFQWSLQTASLYQIIWYIIDNCQPQNKQDCCLLHSWQQSLQGLEDDKIYQISQNYKNKCQGIKQLIKYIIRNLCSTRRYDLLLRKNKGNQEVIIESYRRKMHNFSIFQYLKYDGYSICLKKMLLQCIQVGVIQDSRTLMKQTQLLDCMYGQLQVSELRDQIVPVISVLNQCSKILILVRDPKYIEIIRQIGTQMDKLYMKKYAFVRLRSKSDGIPIKKKLSDRKLLHEEDNVSCNSMSEVKQGARQKQKIIKAKLIKLRKQKSVRIANDQQLYDLLTNICCFMDPQSKNYMLIDDDCTKIINPYFKICSTHFQVKLIQMIRTTVLVKSKLQNLPIKMQSLAKFDQVYRFILSQFILKELDPDDPHYKPSQNQIYIVKNFFYIMDHMVVSMRNDWDSLYLFILRMIGILAQAKKDIHIKTQRSKQDILMACKVCVRKFVLRVLKHAEKSIQNMSNMVFLIYLVVFDNPQTIFEEVRLFDYFSSLEKNFFIGPIQIKSYDDHQIIKQNIFIDQRIILTYLDGFKIDQVFNKDKIEPSKKRRYTINIIQAYLNKDEQNQLQDYLYKLRKVFLSKSQFKQISNQNQDNKGIRKMISMFMINNNANNNSNQEGKTQNFQTYNLYVGEIIGLLICLTIQSSIISKRQAVLKQALSKLILFIKAFSLSCSRDCLTRKDHKYRNQTTPQKIVYHLIHFLYQMMQRLQDRQTQTRLLLRQSIYQILSFITILMTVLSEKVGNPNTMQQLLMIASIKIDVQQYNYYILQVMKNVITLNQIRIFSTIPIEKAYDVIEHQSMKDHFKLTPAVFLQKHIKQVVQIHSFNTQKIQTQLDQKFQQDALKRKPTQSQISIVQSTQFQQYRLDHARKIDFQYRQVKRVWHKIWKRLRLYHYQWSISMDQREQMKCQWQKFKQITYKHKFGKYTDLDGLRPILQVEPVEPWHVKKAQLDEQVKYRSKNFMVNLYKLHSQKNIKSKSIMDILLLRKSSAVLQYFQVQWIKHNSKRKGRLSFKNDKLVFQYQSTFQKDSHVDFTSFTLAQHRTIDKNWSLATIVNIITRRYLMRRECLLIQFQDGSAVIFDFLNDDTQEFLSKIEKIQAEKSQMINFMKANKIAFYTKKFNKTNYQQQIDEATQQWSQGNMTNLQYLMILNKYSGRSYLDPVNFCVVPWVVANYDFKELVFRDLSKSLGALGSLTRKQFYQHKVDAVDPFNNVPAYQFGTHYSSPGVVFNFLIRLSPYTQAGRTLQGGKFDLSDRLFSSIKVCWHSVRNQVSDVRELTPQFFYLPQFLLNLDNYDYGLTQMKQRVDNVKLPMWASTPYDFICSHRRALQSDQVSSNIQNWIDLIFGYKQKGKLARENLNLYYYLTYEDSIDLKKIDDPVQRTSIQAQIIHFGQTPSQLFTKPHPPKKFLKTSHSLSEPQKIKFLGLIQSQTPLILLSQPQPNSNLVLIFTNSSLLTVQTGPTFSIKSQSSLLRSSSKQGLYFIQQPIAQNKVIVFGSGKYVVVGAYVNGDIVVYTVTGKKICQKKGTQKSVIFVNKAENLLLCGCKNGLLQVYQIVYAEKQSVNLIKIVNEYFMFPIQHISEGAGFFSISSGNLVVINKITRGLNYVYDKIKMQGTKMIRSFESKRKVHGSYICSNPLYCVVFYNSLQIYIYSINGQFLKLRQIQNLIPPIIMTDYMQRENVLALQPNGLLVLKVPELETICSIPVPRKQYTSMKIIGGKLYLVTNNGEILVVFDQKEVVFY